VVAAGGHAPCLLDHPRLFLGAASSHTVPVTHSSPPPPYLCSPARVPVPCIPSFTQVHQPPSPLNQSILKSCRLCLLHLTRICPYVSVPTWPPASSSSGVPLAPPVPSHAAWTGSSKTGFLIQPVCAEHTQMQPCSEPLLQPPLPHLPFQLVRSALRASLLLQRRAPPHQLTHFSLLTCRPPADLAPSCPPQGSTFVLTIL
jgi:hypothetical protein